MWNWGIRKTIVYGLKNLNLTSVCMAKLCKKSSESTKRVLWWVGRCSRANIHRDADTYWRYEVNRPTNIWRRLGKPFMYLYRVEMGIKDSLGSQANFCLNWLQLDDNTSLLLFGGLLLPPLGIIHFPLWMCLSEPAAVIRHVSGPQVLLTPIWKQSKGAIRTRDMINFLLQTRIRFKKPHTHRALEQGVLGAQLH